MPIPAALVDAAQGWSSLYGNSKPISIGVSFAHLAAILIAGGTALVADRRILRAGGASEADRIACLNDLEAAHRTVIAGLAVVFVSGLAMFAADLDTFVRSGFFWTKMLLVVLLLVNGSLLRRWERVAHGAASARVWARLRLAAVLSITLWFLVLLAGTVLRTAA